MINLFSKYFLKKPVFRITNLFLNQISFKANYPQNCLYNSELQPFAINTIFDNHGANKKKKRLGRGPGSGKGKTSGRGHKGKKARSGSSVPAYREGGQNPLTRRLPKFGDTRRNKDRFQCINLGKIVEFVKKGRLDSSDKITLKDMYDCRLFSKIRFGVKILGRGSETLDFPLNIEVSDASQLAIDAIKKNGGNISCVYRTKLKIKEHLKPEKFPIKLNNPLPTKSAITRLLKIEERGATVIYEEPLWVKEKKEEIKNKEVKNDEIEKENLKVEQKTKDKVKKPKNILYQTIKFKI